MASLASTTAVHMPDATNESTPHECDRPFDFLGLPRELREMIYTQPGFYEEILCCQPTRDRLKMTIRKPSTSMFLVNHQFSRDSVAQSFNRMHDLDILEARLIVYEKIQMENYLIWLASCLAHASKLRYITFEIYVDDGCVEDYDSEYLNAAFTPIIKYDKLRRLRIYSSDDPCRVYAIPSSGRKKWLLSDWKRGGKPAIELLDEPVEPTDVWKVSRKKPGQLFSEPALDATGELIECQDEDMPQDSESEDNSSVESDDSDFDSDDSDSDSDAEGGTNDGDHGGSDSQHSGRGENGSFDENDSGNKHGDGGAEPGDGDGVDKYTRPNDSNPKPSDDDYDSDDEDEDDDKPDAEYIKRSAKPANITDYFDFFGLPREIRDMIYEQPQLLVERAYEMRPSVEKHPMTAEQYEEQRLHLTQTRHLPHIVTSNPTPESVSLMICRQPITSLLLVNDQFNDEYSQSCEGRVEVSISERLGGFDSMPEPPFAVKEASSLKVNVGLMQHMSSTFSGDTWSMENWLSKWTAQMPLLRSIDVTIYASEGPSSWKRGFPYHECGLDGVTELQTTKRLKIVTMGTPLVLLHWSEEDGQGVKLPKQPVSLARWEARYKSVSDAMSSSANSNDSNIASMDDLFDKFTAADADRKTWQEQLYDEKTYLERDDHGANVDKEREMAMESETEEDDASTEL